MILSHFEHHDGSLSLSLSLTYYGFASLYASLPHSLTHFLSLSFWLNKLILKNPNLFCHSIKHMWNSGDESMIFGQKRPKVYINYSSAINLNRYSGDESWDFWTNVSKNLMNYFIVERV
jgi:hypothetical protein